MDRFYAIIYPIPEYIENDYKFKHYSNFIEAHLNCKLLNKLKDRFKNILDAIRERYTIVWYITKDSEVSKIFDVDESDKIIRDSLTTKDLLYSTKYSSFRNLISNLKHYKNLEEIVVDGFHRNDCVIRCYGCLIQTFRNKKISIGDKINDINVEKIIKSYLVHAYNKSTLSRIKL